MGLPRSGLEPSPGGWKWAALRKSSQKICLWADPSRINQSEAGEEGKDGHPNRGDNRRKVTEVKSALGCSTSHLAWLNQGDLGLI